MNIRKAQSMAIFIVVFVVLLLLFSGLSMLSDEPISNFEKRIYVIVFLFLLLTLVVAIILIRNSITANTAFLIRLRDSMTKNGKSLDSLEKTILSLTREMATLNKSIKNENQKENDSKNTV